MIHMVTGEAGTQYYQAKEEDQSTHHKQETFVAVP
jgi:hypothetical protein